MRAGSEPGLRADAGSPLTRGKGQVLAWFALAGVLLGLATLTRAVFLLFPLALVEPEHRATLRERLQKHVVLFEDDHPQLGAAMNSAINTLSLGGI